MASVATKTGIESLPNELILTILSTLPTRTLTRLSPTSHRFHSLIRRLIHARLLAAAHLQGDHTLLLECFYPSAKLTEPPLYCRYLGTTGLDSGEVDAGRDPSQYYSRFVPYHGLDDASAGAGKGQRWRHPAGDIPGSRTYQPQDSQSEDAQVEEEVVKPVTQTISLEGHELFTQLCALTNLVKVGPRNGLFMSCVEVSDGVMRVWRDWLAGMAAPGIHRAIDAANASKTAVAEAGDPRILWINDGENVGVRVRVRERKWRRDNPVLIARDEDVAVSYDVEYEELLVRTTHLLLKLEQSLLEQANHSVPRSPAPYWDGFLRWVGEMIFRFLVGEKNAEIFEMGMARLGAMF